MIVINGSRGPRFADRLFHYFLRVRGGDGGGGDGGEACGKLGD